MNRRPSSENIFAGQHLPAHPLKHYNSQNLLARSLHPLAYERNPGFLHFKKQSGLPFRPHTQFKRADIAVRGELYLQLAERIWNPDDLLNEVSQ